MRHIMQRFVRKAWSIYWRVTAAMTVVTYVFFMVQLKNAGAW